ncbi:MAG: hypothetical protein ACPGQD_05930 [Planctomycetota bacterium]
MQKLHEKYESQGLVVLGFPCNQFGNQEPGTNEEVLEFAVVRLIRQIPDVDVDGHLSNWSWVVPPGRFRWGGPRRTEATAYPWRTEETAKSPRTGIPARSTAPGPRRHPRPPRTSARAPRLGHLDGLQAHGVGQAQLGASKVLLVRITVEAGRRREQGMAKPSARMGAWQRPRTCTRRLCACAAQARPQPCARCCSRAAPRLARRP